MTQTRRRPAVAGPGVRDEHVMGMGAQDQYIADADAPAIPDCLGRHRMPCARCDRGPRDRAMSVRVDTDGGAVWMCHRCGWSGGVAADQSPEAHERRRRRMAARDEVAARRRVAIRSAVAGTTPDRRPPYARQLPRRGDVVILAASGAWPSRPVPALVLPPRHTPTAYRWPVRGRRVTVIDLADAPTHTAGYDHPGENWRACPHCWASSRRDWLRAWARVMIRRDGATVVRVVASADRATYRREVRYGT